MSTTVFFAGSYMRCRHVVSVNLVNNLEVFLYLAAVYAKGLLFRIQKLGDPTTQIGG